MKLLISAMACALLTTGCAGMSDSDCRTDWYQLGARDGRLGASSQLDLYAARCTAQPDSSRYSEGYRAGFSERPVPTW